MRMYGARPALCRSLVYVEILAVCVATLWLRRRPFYRVPAQERPVARLCGVYLLRDRAPLRLRALVRFEVGFLGFKLRTLIFSSGETSERVNTEPSPHQRFFAAAYEPG